MVTLTLAVALLAGAPGPQLCDESRFVIIGQSFEGSLIVVVHSELEDSIRIISARPATRREREVYEQV